MKRVEGGSLDFKDNDLKNKLTLIFKVNYETVLISHINYNSIPYLTIDKNLRKSMIDNIKNLLERGKLYDKL